MLFVLLLMLDRIAAFSLIPLSVYRVYGIWWGYLYGKSIALGANAGSTATHQTIIVSPSSVRFTMAAGWLAYSDDWMTRPTIGRRR